jgi:hypothetical protein
MLLASINLMSWVLADHQSFWRAVSDLSLAEYILRASVGLASLALVFTSRGVCCTLTDLVRMASVPVPQMFIVSLASMILVRQAGRQAGRWPDSLPRSLFS